jgi:hypothetical protein
MDKSHERYTIFFSKLNVGNFIDNREGSTEVSDQTNSSVVVGGGKSVWAYPWWRGAWAVVERRGFRLFCCDHS